MKVAIIGGGAAGLMCGAILASHSVYATIFDGNEKLGKKIYITGKGRCNLTNNCSPNEFLDNVVNGKKFMIGAINRFPSSSTMAFFEEQGLKLKTERGNRVFPVSDKASDVIKALEKANKGNIIKLNTFIKSVKKVDKGYKIITQTDEQIFDIVVVATGGVSYSSTGSTGQGLEFAKRFGHNIVKTIPALVAIELKDKVISTVQGLSLKNVTLKAEYQNVDGKKFSHSIFGEMLFTDKGVSGPIVLSMSSFINRAKDIKLAIDFKPALSYQQLDARLLRDFEENKNKNISAVIRGLLPKNLVNIFLECLQIPQDKKVNSITKQERENIANLLKDFTLTFKGFYPIESAIITSGGVDTNQINPKSCESKLQNNLYFVGEVLNVDCLTGGFNLQTAWSTAYIAAQNIIEKINNQK